MVDVNAGTPEGSADAFLTPSDTPCGRSTYQGDSVAEPVKLRPCNETSDGPGLVSARRFVYASP